MNKAKLINLVKTFCLGVVAVLDEPEQATTTHKTIPKPAKKAAYTAKSQRDLILIYADKHGTHAAAAKFKVPVQRVAAYKAHRTMGTYN